MRLLTKIRNAVIRRTACLIQSADEDDKKKLKSLKKYRKKFSNLEQACMENYFHELEKVDSNLYRELADLISEIPGSVTEAFRDNLYVHAFAEGYDTIHRRVEIANEAFYYKRSLPERSEDSSEAETEHDIQDDVSCELVDANVQDLAILSDESSDSSDLDTYENEQAKRFASELRLKCNQQQLMLNEMEIKTIQDHIQKWEELALDKQSENEQLPDDKKRAAFLVRADFWEQLSNEGLPFSLYQILKSTPSKQLSLSEEIKVLQIWLRG